MAKKKVLIFSLAYYPKHIGGAEAAIKEITDRISPDDVEFHMVTNRFDTTLPKKELVGNVLVHRIGIATRDPAMKDLKRFPLHLNKMLFQFLAVWKGALLYRKHRYDALWCMMAHSTGVPGGLFKTYFPNVEYLLTLQEGDPPEYIEKKMAPLGPLFKRGFTKADRIQVISTFLGEWAKRMGYAGEPILIPNAVNTKHFSQEYSKQDLDAVRQKLGKKEGDVFMITTSRLVKKNACDDVIKSLPHLPENVHFAILGTGPDEDMLRILAEDLGVASRVHFVGFVDHAEMPKYLKACDIFIRPSLSEGFGSSFVEAFAAEIPVIATQEGGIRDFLFDSELNPDKNPTGRAVQARDPEGIARAVKLFIEDEAMTKQIVKNAKELAFSKYDWETIARDMRERFFQGIVMRTAILVHGYHTGAKEWGKTVWGTPPHQLGQLPRAALLVHEYEPELVIFGSGVDAPNEKSEGQYSRDYLFDKWETLAEFDSFDNINLNALRSSLKEHSVFLTSATNTWEEFIESTPILEHHDIERLVLVSSRSHTPRALLTALKVMKEGCMPAVDLIAVPSDVEPPAMPVEDIVTFEPPHRPDRVDVVLSRELKKILEIPQEKLGAFREKLSSLIKTFL